jgi:4-hydroxythreonine-4-phosphate dehydrogenase
VSTLDGDRRATPLVVTPGDPAGIGPEVVCKALVAEPRPAVIIGDGEAVRRWAARVGLTLGDSAAGVSLLVPDRRDEPVEIAALRLAVAACLEGRARALVTGPIHKARLAKRGFPHHGHTEFLGLLSGVERPVMAFVGGRVRVALVTVHVPLRDVATRLTTDRVLHTIRAADRALREHLGVARPRLAVCGPNPHAGDQGVLGDEDLRIVAPAVEAARAEGIDATGPVSAEAAFRSALQGRADLVVAAYHDQGLVPLKALAAAGASEDHAVNWTLGLPFVRTSVDHGTADDIAGQGIADPGSMLAAMRLAEQLTR